MKTSYTRNYELSKSAITTNNPLLAEERYKHLLKTYTLYYDLDSIQSHLRGLKKSKKYVNALNQRKRAFEKEAVLGEKLISRYLMEFDHPEKANLKWWEKELEKLDKLNAKSNPETNKMVERVLFKLFATAYETPGSESNISKAQEAFRKTVLSKMQNRLLQKSTTKNQR